MEDIKPVDTKKKEFQSRDESVLIDLSGKFGLQNNSCTDQTVSISSRIILFRY